MTTHKILIHKLNNMLEVTASWKDLTMSVYVKPEERAEGVRKMKNSIAALETYGDKIITKRDSGNTFINWFRKIFKLATPGFDYRVINVKKIPKNFNKEEVIKKLFFKEIQLP